MLLTTVLFLFPFSIFFLLHRWLRYRDHSNQKISKSYHRGMSVIPFKWCMKTKLWGQEGSGGLVAHYSNFWRKVVLKCHTCIWQLPQGMKINECSAALSAVFEMGLTCSASLWLLEAPRAKGLWVDVTSKSMYSCRRVPAFPSFHCRATLNVSP